MPIKTLAIKYMFSKFNTSIKYEKGYAFDTDMLVKHSPFVLFMHDDELGIDLEAEVKFTHPLLEHMLLVRAEVVQADKRITQEQIQEIQYELEVTFTILEGVQHIVDDLKRKRYVMLDRKGRVLDVYEEKQGQLIEEVEKNYDFKAA